MSESLTNNSPWSYYDVVSRTLTIYFYGKPTPAYVNWINDKVGTLHDDTTHAIVGVKIDNIFMEPHGRGETDVRVGNGNRMWNRHAVTPIAPDITVTEILASSNGEVS